MFEIGDSVRFVKTGITAKIVDIKDGRLIMHISPDDLGLMGFDLEDITLPVVSTIPVENASYMLKI